MNYIQILLKIFPALVNDLISYMSIIRSAIPDVPFEKCTRMTQQFRLRMARDHRRSWAIIDGQLWLQCVATGGYSVTQSTPCMSYTVNRPCYDYNIKVIVHVCSVYISIHASVVVKEYGHEGWNSALSSKHIFSSYSANICLILLINVIC